MIREQYVVTLQPAQGVDAALAIRRLLKFALRSCGMRCTAIRCDAPLLEDLAQSRVTKIILAHDDPEYGQ